MKSLTVSVWVRVIGLACLCFVGYWWLVIIIGALLLGTADQVSPVKLGLNTSTPVGRLFAEMVADVGALSGIALVLSPLRFVSIGVTILLLFVVLPQYIKVIRLTFARMKVRRGK
jgi:hypothetical protein